MKRHRLLIIDDEKEILRSLTLTFIQDYEVFTTSSGIEALDIVAREDISLILADQRMPEMTGIELLTKVYETHPNIIRILLTGYTDTAAIIDAINQGHIYQYITKPWDRQQLRIIVKRALDSYEMLLENQRLFREIQAANLRLINENVFLKREINKEWQDIAIIGQSEAMQQVFTLLQRVTANPVTVLLTGETGVGKTLLARYLHYHGPRKNQLFIEQNCGTLPEALLESELFGHKRGAFTGAVHDRKGLFEAADGGTLLLDEVSEMSPALQVKLLQVLQEGKFRRLGENETRQVDVRIIAATNKDLKAAVESGQFRLDLYYRLNVFPIHIPPLRDRLDDIPELAQHCLTKQARKLNSHIVGFNAEAMRSLCSYDYPGNVRELENLIERALILSTGPQIEVGEWLPLVIVELNGLSKLQLLERAQIKRLLDIYPDNLAKIAQTLNLSRTTLWRRIKDYQLQTPLLKDPDVSA